ncbi:hypothetical protein MJO28_006408 [Puccinia striiformis f. sp. tritici]|uniref:ER membrane protein complex subunit 7 beta-sandwich domain-containing protein n=2 Tax=Puccinia striiformis f. sp. tritici TaxID=168172 RepID=A0A0L0VAH1_9BASI|nr:hypothetical protein Pst134EA_011580 [Puccinia striiformis f. sp. tritici]KAI9609006.1 hypothetical protein KEM48_003088 [Puccinia striiformis f. sp. tritici PST-130]KNE95954.1 hypothetical protein PSTG_10752 [Puccinia striiformis f. sp. tritici PST-78]KAH9456367.1 hypothetical protein Pst134EB_012564 [Puccinia striiformis f. sp. tritici]KAH9467960.1 hypothetical protein Pst134EA_011580 [Puccinia striiformis f. sp. tritici]KAI7953861.1 hypothetical protein MJO28_006408 [Puccinia striiformis
MRTTSLPRITLWLSALTFQHMVVLGVDVVGRVAWNTALPDINSLPTDSKVVLRSGRSVEDFIRQDGTFILQDIEPGKYVLTVQCRTVAFPALSIEVLPPSQDDLRHPVVKHHVYGQAPPPPPDPLAPPRPERRLDYPIQLIPTAKIQYEEIKVGFNPIAMLMGNPMYLLMGGMAVFMMIMPKLIGLMDPETLAEVQANQADLHKQMASIQDMDLTSGFSKMLSASNDGDEQPSGSQASAKSTSHASESHAKRRK